MDWIKGGGLFVAFGCLLVVTGVTLSSGINWGGGGDGKSEIGARIRVIQTGLYRQGAKMKMQVRGGGVRDREETRRLVTNEIKVAALRMGLGDLEVIFSEIVDFEDGSRQRQSIVRGSRSQSLVLVLEHLGWHGGVTRTTFHNAQRLIVRVDSEGRREGLVKHLTDLGFENEGDAGWLDFIAVKVIPGPQYIFETMEALRGIVGRDGAVFLGGVLAE